MSRESTYGVIDKTKYCVKDIKQLVDYCKFHTSPNHMTAGHYEREAMIPIFEQLLEDLESEPPKDSSNLED